MTMATGVGRGHGRLVLPYEPFGRALVLREKPINGFAENIQRLVHRARVSGSFTRVGADLAAAAIGCHPSELWGREWDA